jgi:hypothetical protein
LFSPRKHHFAQVLLFAVGYALWKGAADHEDAPKKRYTLLQEKNDM